MEQLCAKITDKLIAGGYIKADTRDWMIYILQKQIMKCIGVGLFLVLLGLLVGWWNALAFYAAFTGLRTYAGGWHAPKPWLCFVLSGAIALAVGLVGPLTAQWPVWVRAATAAASVAILLLLAPVQPTNLPLTAAERAVNRRKMLKILAAAAAALLLTETVKIGKIAAYLTAAILCAALTVLAAHLANKKSGKSRQKVKNAATLTFHLDLSFQALYNESKEK